MEKFATFIVAMFLYGGVVWLLNAVIANTTVGVQIAITLVPLIIAVVVVAYVARLLG